MLTNVRDRVEDFVKAKDGDGDVLGDDNDDSGGGDDLGVEFGLNLQIEAEGGSERERERERGAERSKREDPHNSTHSIPRTPHASIFLW